MTLVAQAGAQTDDLEGKTTVEAIKQYYWFDKSYSNAVFDEALINKIKTAINQYQIIVFGGSWCTDTQYNVPEFVRLLDQVNYDKSKLTLYFLNRKKTSKEGFEKNYKIENVPTVILLKDGKEIARIVEDPKERYDKDLIRLLDIK